MLQSHDTRCGLVRMMRRGFEGFGLVYGYRELKAKFAAIYGIIFLTGLIIVWSIDLQSPIPIVIEAMAVWLTVELARRKKRRRRGASED